MTVRNLEGLSPESGPESRAQIVARRVRELMGGRRLYGQDMAYALDLSQAAFSRRINGELEFTVTQIEQLARIFRVDEAYLFGFSDDRSHRRSAPGGGSTFVPIEGGTPSGTRTPNPLISGQERPLRLIGGGSSTSPRRPARHLQLVGRAS